MFGIGCNTNIPCEGIEKTVFLFFSNLKKKRKKREKEKKKRVHEEKVLYRCKNMTKKQKKTKI